MATRIASAPASKHLKQPSKPRVPRPNADIEKTDARFQHVSNTLLQRSPYLLEVPENKPFHHRPYGESEIRRVDPFGANEEQLQYMSFHNRDDNDDTVFRVIGGWDNEKGEIEIEKPSPIQSKSGSSTPAGGAPKKKISLAEYKKKTTVAKDAPKAALPGSKPDKPDKPTPQADTPNGKPNSKLEAPIKKVDHKR